MTDKNKELMVRNKRNNGILKEQESQRRCEKEKRKIG